MSRPISTSRAGSALDSIFAAALLLVATSACAPEERFGVHLPTASGAARDLFLEVEGDLSPAIGTVFELRWASEEFVEAWVSYGLDGALDQRAQATADGLDYQATLLGLKPGREYSFRLEARLGGELLSTDLGSFVTGQPPSDLPEIWIDSHDSGATEGGYVALSLVGNTNAVAVVDRDGEYVWWHIEEEPGVVLTRIAPTSDGQSFLYNPYFNNPSDEFPPIRQVSLTGRKVEDISIEHNLHHDFTPLPDGGLAYLAYYTQEVDGVPWSGDCIVERDPEGQERVVWSSWDSFELLDEDIGDNSWTHTNALAYDATLDAYQVSVGSGPSWW